MDITQFYTGTLSNLDTTGYYYNQLVDSISPSITFLYDNFLTNPIFYGIIICCLVVSFFSFGSE